AAGTKLVSLYRLNQSGNKLFVSHSGTSYAISGTLPLKTWGNLKLHVITFGTGASTVEVWLDGTQVYQTTTASLGATGVKTIQIGNNASGKTFDLVADDIVATKGNAGPAD